MREPVTSESSERITPRLVLGMVAELAGELAGAPVAVDSLSASTSLERELGFDSLSRLELAARLEGRLGRRYAGRTALLAETVGDLLAAGAVEEESEAELPASPGVDPSGPVGPVDVAPPRTALALRCLPDILERLAANDPDFVCIRLLDERGGIRGLTAGELLEDACRVASGLEWRLAGREPVALTLPTGRDFLAAFFGIQLAGGIPVPLAPAPRPTQIEDHLRRQVGILDDCGARLLIAPARGGSTAGGGLTERVLRLEAATLEQVVTVEELSTDRPAVVRWRAAEDDIALLQYTSGSTGAPKGVVLTHRNLLANLDAIAAALETGPGDVFVSWLPLHHDMGLIGGVLHPLHCGIPLVLLSPLAFLSRPLAWLEAIDRFRGTLTVAPNFAYELCQRRAAESETADLDLSRLRLALNGAEPILAATIERFAERFGPMGFRRQAMLPVYGLAENTLAVSFAARGAEPLVDRVRRRELESIGRAIPASPDDDSALRFVSCGRPLDGVEVRVAGAAGEERAERRVGRVLFRGSSASRGYYGDSRPADGGRGEWIDSGDLGYRAGGELFLTGRSSDVVVQAGRNLSPDTLEEAAGEVTGVRRGCVVVFGVEDPQRGTERLVLVAETRRQRSTDRRRLEGEVRESVRASTGVVPDEIHLVAPRSLLKTSSGKIRRRACRRLFVDGRLDATRRRSPRRQMTAVVLRVVRRSGRSSWRAVPHLAYTAWAWAVAAPLLALAWTAVVTLPVEAWRSAAVRIACRAFFAAIGVDIRRRGPLRPPAGSVLVSNHASYLDGMLLLAVVDAPLSFVAKRDFERSPITRWLLRRLDAVLVDPRGEGDVERELERMSDRLAAGRVLVIFAEGTFGPAPGLRPFRLGAFVLAARTGRPLVPLAISGTRRLLRDRQWWFRRGPVTIEVGDPLLASSRQLAAAIELRERARGFVAARVNEPDLTSTGATPARGALPSSSAVARHSLLAAEEAP